MTPQLTKLRPALVVFGALLSLCIAWMSVLPLFAGPDEPANFVKSAAVARGEWIGGSIYPSATASFWSTYVDIDEQFGTANQVPWCFVGQPQVPACDKPLSWLTPTEPTRTDMGRYPSFGFIPTAFGTLVGPSDSGARAARLTGAIIMCAVLALAAELLRRRRRSIVPWLVATTPGVLFLASVTSPSGLEIAAAIAGWTALWTGVHERWSSHDTTGVFVLASSMLVLTRPAGVVTVAVMLLVALLADHRSLLGGIRHDWRTAGWLAAALLASGTWYFAVYDDYLAVRLDLETRVTKLSTIATRSVSDLPRVVSESIGNFGWLDTQSPTFVVWAFVALSAALTWSAFGSSTVRERVALAVALLVVPVWHIVLNMNYQDLLGLYGTQGRHLTPFLVGLPLAASMRRRAQASDRVIVTMVVALHLWCVLATLRRYSSGVGGDDILGFVRDPAWTPPLGMSGTLAVVGVTHAAAWFGLRSYAGRMER